MRRIIRPANSLKPELAHASEQKDKIKSGKSILTWPSEGKGNGQNC